MPEESLLQLGALGIILVFAIREFFAYLKLRGEATDKKEETNTGNVFSEAIFKELQTMNNNHLHSLQEAIEEGNRHLIDSIHTDNTKIIELLGEIKGNLQGRGRR